MRRTFVWRDGKVVPKETADLRAKDRQHEIHVGPGEPLRSKTLPPFWKYAPRHAPDGSPEFHSMREIRESVAKANDHGEGVVYQRGFHRYE